MNMFFSYRLFIWITCFGTFFWINFVFSIYKYIYLYCNLQWNTFWFDTFFPIKWCWKTTYKRKPENIYFGWDKPTQDKKKKTLVNIYIFILYIHGYVCPFLVPKRVLWEEKRTPHFETTPPTHLLRKVIANFVVECISRAQNNPLKTARKSGWSNVNFSAK